MWEGEGREVFVYMWSQNSEGGVCLYQKEIGRSRQRCGEWKRKGGEVYIHMTIVVPCEIVREECACTRRRLREAGRDVGRGGERGDRIHEVPNKIVSVLVPEGD
jgi:hypothetical protein